MSSLNFEEILALPVGPKRTAYLAAWIQSLYDNADSCPVLVGGAAVELYTGGAYTTGDLDFVGEVPPSVARKLKEHGFEKQGRHWLHERARLFIEFPGSRLEHDARPARFLSDDASVTIISPEDLLVDRLASWKFWGHSPDGMNAALLYLGRKDMMDHEYLDRAADRADVSDALESLKQRIMNLPEGDEKVELIKTWAEKK